jgi:hypothetical protein
VLELKAELMEEKFFSAYMYTYEHTHVFSFEGKKDIYRQAGKQEEIFKDIFFKKSSKKVSLFSV